MDALPPRWRGSGSAGRNRTSKLAHKRLKLGQRSSNSVVVFSYARKPPTLVSGALLSNTTPQKQNYFMKEGRGVYLQVCPTRRMK